MENDLTWGIYDRMGNRIIRCEYKAIVYDKDINMFFVKSRNETWGLYDRMGNEIIPCQFKEINYSKGKNMLSTVDEDGVEDFIDLLNLQAEKEKEKE